MTITLHQGPWQDYDWPEIDFLCPDHPFAPRVHDGDVAAAFQQKSVTGQDIRRTINYAAWGADELLEFGNYFLPRTRGWSAAFCSHQQIPVWEELFRRHGRYWSQPALYLRHCPRLSGDGHSSQADYIMWSRPSTRKFSTWECLPGKYQQREHNKKRVGGKCWIAVAEMIRDHSNPGDLVCDPCMGAGTAAIAARAMGRDFIGGEIDPVEFGKAEQWLSEQWFPLQISERTRDNKRNDKSKVKPEQVVLF